MAWIEPFGWSPYPWIALASLCFGVAVRALLPIPRLRSRRRRREERFALTGGGTRRRRTVRGRAIAAGLFLLSFVLIFTTLALLIPGPERFFDPDLIRFAAGVAAVGFAAALAPLLIGVPLLLIAVPAIALFSAYTATWQPLGDPESAVVTVARLRAVAATAGRLTVETASGAVVATPGRFDAGWEDLLVPAFELPGDALAVTVDTLLPHPAWLVAGLRPSVRLTGIAGYRFDATEGSFTPTADHAIPTTIRTAVGARIDSLLRGGAIPGVRADAVRGTPRRVGLLTEYRARFSPPSPPVLVD
ncbi:MAG: hypothetical protein EA403_17435 [Spirochaetaceae bacterium]|nr:MAG: hypothetical protein EA403_17435 [Spirochaetaceae bacterium]